MTFFLQAFVTLFVIIDPPGIVPLFLGLTRGRSVRTRRRLAWQAAVVAFSVIVAFALFGRVILNYTQVQLAALEGAGGLLLLRARDRDCAAAVLDRVAPGPVRRMIWARLHAGEPGPFPAVYDPVASDRGLQAYAVSHGLVIVRRETARTVPGPPGRLTSAIAMARTLVARLSRGRLTDAHDELLYVIRKPEDRFARLV